MKTVLKTDKNYANNLKYKRIKKLILSVSFAVLFAPSGSILVKIGI